MGKRGPQPKRIISERWTPELAYAIGLIATDGSLARTTYLINLTSKDKEQLKNFSKCLGLSLNIGEKFSGSGNRSYYVQFKNVYFYNFLITVGLTPAKSKSLGRLKIPKQYFFDFLRGCFDGDGYSYSYWDPRWRSSFMFYVGFVSASPDFLNWLRDEIRSVLKIEGHFNTMGKRKYFQLKYAKSEGFTLLESMYSKKGCVCLSRKRLKIEKMLSIVGKQQNNARVVKLVDTLP